MPDWTYVPLRRPAIGIFGSEKRSQRAAMSFMRRLARLPSGGRVIASFDYTHDHVAAAVDHDGTSYPSPIGVVVTHPGEDTNVVFQSMGFGFATEADKLPDGATISSACSASELLAELDGGATLLAANAAVLADGPAVAQRVNEALAARAHRANTPERVQWLRPWSWPAWVWALWLGIAMVCAGIGAAIITVGPVILGYDEDFLGVSIDQLDDINDRLVPFLQHDRITMAGCMMAIGFNDIGFAFAMRRGWRWARAGFLIAGAVGFPTFFLFLGYNFFDPLHFATAIGFFPLYLLGVFGRQVSPTWDAPVDIADNVRTPAIHAQLMMVAMAIGVFLSGLVIMIVGLQDVLIPSDRAYLGDSQEFFETTLDGRLLRFIAHDRAGFGGTLASLGAGVLTMTMWGWRAGERSTWWTLTAASTVGLGAALAVHLFVGYTDFVHLLPVYVGIIWVTVVLTRSRRWFFHTGVASSTNHP